MHSSSPDPPTHTKIGTRRQQQLWARKMWPDRQGWLSLEGGENIQQLSFRGVQQMARQHWHCSKCGFKCQHPIICAGTVAQPQEDPQKEGWQRLGGLESSVVSFDEPITQGVVGGCGSMVCPQQLTKCLEQGGAKL